MHHLIFRNLITCAGFMFIWLSCGTSMAADEIEDDEKAAHKENVVLLVVQKDHQAGIYTPELLALLERQEILARNPSESPEVKKRSRNCLAFLSASMLVASGAMFTAGGLVNFKESNCWSFICDAASNFTQLVISSKDCASRCVSESCVVLGALCQDTIGSIINATAQFDDSCQEDGGQTLLYMAGACLAFGGVVASYPIISSKCKSTERLITRKINEEKDQIARQIMKDLCETDLLTRDLGKIVLDYLGFTITDDQTLAEGL